MDIQATSECRTAATEESQQGSTESTWTTNSANSSIPLSMTITDLRALIQALRAPAPPMPEFSGFDHEDPEIFLRECENYLRQTEIARSHWTRTTGKALQDTAAKWWSAYKSFNLPWEEFCELFTNKFAGTSTILRLRTQLYSTKQLEKEPVGLFLQKKYLLAKRLRPGDTEEELVSLMLETIKPSIRRVIRAANPTTFTDLVNRANQVEADDLEALGTKPRPEEKPKSAPSKPLGSSQARGDNTEQYVPRCYYCPGRHLHKDCPVLAEQKRNQPQENWRRAADHDSPAQGSSTNQ